MTQIEWWAYIHENGTLHVRRYFDMLDILEAQESPFVKRVFGPMPIDTREGALAYFTEKAREVA